MNEAKLQSDCHVWFWNEYPDQRRMLFHPDNNSVNQIVGARKKALGVVKGVSDLVLIMEGRVIFIELKVDRNVLTPEQVDFKQKVESRNHEFYLIRTFDAFKALIKLLYGK